MNDREDGDVIPAVMEASSFSQVVFNDVPKSYPPNSALTCRYQMTGGLQPNPRDWIGIFKVGWQSTQGYYCYEWTQPCLDQVGPEALMQNVVFKESYLPKDDGEFYQFCYVDENGHVKGASTPFCFRNQAETSLDCSLEKDLLVVTTQEEAKMIEKEKEDLLEEIKHLKESSTIVKKELDERLHEIYHLRSCLEELKSKEKTETSSLDIPNFAEEKSLQKAVRKIETLQREKADLQQQVELQYEENLKINTCLKETKHNNNKLQDLVKLLEMDVQSSMRHNEKLQAEIEELFRVNKTQEEKRGGDMELQGATSMSDRRGQDNDAKVQIRALLTQLTEARGLSRSEMQNCREATKRAEIAEKELKEVKKQLAEMSKNEAEADKCHQIQAKLEQAQDKIYEMAETSRLDKDVLMKKNEELKAEVSRLRKAVFDYQVASVAAVSEQLPNPQSPLVYRDTQDQTHSGDQPSIEKEMKCQYCQESFPGISEDELAIHEHSHRLCPLCPLIFDDSEQQQYEDHVYGHEEFHL